tara:strand:+ start:11005 stop:11355 length:351 start_codon:yes stop_codon:yes gene_type:complete
MSISQGSDFLLAITIKDSSGTPIDLTGHSFRGQIRKTASDPLVLADFSFNILDQVSSTGRVDVILPSTDSSTIILETSKSAGRKITTFTYDIESEDSGNVVRWLEGLVKMSPEVTR